MSLVTIVAILGVPFVGAGLMLTAARLIFRLFATKKESVPPTRAFVGIWLLIVSITALMVVHLSLIEWHVENRASQDDGSAAVSGAFDEPDGPMRTATCLFESFNVDVDGPVVVGQPFEATLKAQIGSPSSDCAATVSLEAVDSEVSVFGNALSPARTFELKTEEPTWTLLASESDRAYLSVQVEPVAACVESCAVPASEFIGFEVYQDPATGQAAGAVKDLFDGIEVDVTQGESLKVGTLGRVELAVHLAQNVNLGSLDELILELSSPESGVDGREVSIAIDTKRPYESMVKRSLLLDPPTDADRLWLDLKVSGKRGDESFVEYDSKQFGVSVAGLSWFERNVVENINWVTPLVPVTAAVSGFIIAVVRWVLTRRRAKLGDSMARVAPTDTEKYLDDRAYR